MTRHIWDGARFAWICCAGFAVIWYRCQVLTYGPKRCRVKVTARACLPYKGWVDAGTTAYVPTESLLFRRPPGVTRSGQGHIDLSP
jgi:hypothetical protein